ncbi:MAG: hypothetical protein IDH49_09040 [Gammaproteobacteria bacterium]|nr:hypothetical protein [Gammaproteobacteria bacterium]
MRKAILSTAIVLGFSFAPTAFAGEAEDMAEMQRQLNKEVMQQPFSAGDMAKIDSYVADAMKKNLKPIERPPAAWNWQPGYTCNSIFNFGWRAYGDCLHYHRYYGRYWW